MNIRAGDWVTVRPWEEIVATLDRSGELENLPFMAEMLQHCGKRLRVSAVAHKTCDTINKTGGRRVTNAVHLDGIRCDGRAHGGCQAGCLIFWKTDWLQPADEGATQGAIRAPPSTGALMVDDLRAMGVRGGNDEPMYSCQATRLFAASIRLQWWDVRQYVRDVWSGNVRVGRFLRVAVSRVAYSLRNLPTGYRAAVRLHDLLHKVLTGRPTPYRRGLIPTGERTPTETLNLRPGEWVEVKPLDEILTTLSERGRNRGLLFDPEMAQYCTQRFRVNRRVERIIDERTGVMLPMKTPCLVLDGAVCSSEYSAKRVFCPRQIQPYFREIWLRRTRVGAAGVPGAERSAGVEALDDDFRSVAREALPEVRVADVRLLPGHR